MGTPPIRCSEDYAGRASVKQGQLARPGEATDDLPLGAVVGGEDGLLGRAWLERVAGGEEAPGEGALLDPDDIGDDRREVAEDVRWLPCEPIVVGVGEAPVAGADDAP